MKKFEQLDWIDSCDECGKEFPIEKLKYLGEDYLAFCDKCYEK